LNTITLLGLFGALQGLVLAAAVASLGGEARRPSRALAFLLASFAIAVGSVTIQHAGLTEKLLPWVLAEVSVTFVFAPALLFYACVVLGRRVWPATWIHLVPAALWFLYLAAFTIEVRWLATQHLPRWIPPIQAILLYLMSYTTVVAFLTFRIGSEQRALHSHLRVLRVLVILLLALHTAQIIRFIFRDVEALADIVPLTGTVGIYVISILAFRQSWLFAGHGRSPTGRGSQPQPVAPEDAERTKHRLIRLLEDDKPFLNESLSLAEVATRLGVSRSDLSNVVNTRLGVNFSTLISRYRVAEASRILGDPAFDHLTIDAIGYQAGFRSRSAFYGSYKQITGETPRQTRQKRS
jgi:AraC-like DNA-binding protein